MTMHAPFSLQQLADPSVLGSDQITASLLHGHRIYLGTVTGSLLVLDLANPSTRTPPSATLGVRHEGVAKRPIDQLAMLQEMNAIACLAGGDVTLHSLPSFSPLTSFSQLTRSTCSLLAQSTTTTTTTTISTNASPETHTTLALACRRRLVLLSWIDRTWLGSQELALPHQVRGMAFESSDQDDKVRLVAGFSTGEYGIVTLPKLASPGVIGTGGTGGGKNRRAPSGPVSGSGSKEQPILGELFTPTPPQSTTGESGTGTSGRAGSTGAGGGSLSKATGGLGSLGLGALSLGLATKKIDKNDVVAVPRGKRTEGKKDEEWMWGKEWGWNEDGPGHEAEVVVVRDNLAQVLSATTGQSRTAPAPTSIAYPSAVDETIISPPYVISLLSTLSIAVHTIDRLSPIQSLDIPPRTPPPPSSPTKTSTSTSAEPTTNVTARLLTLSSSSPAPPFLILTTSTPATSTPAPPSQTLWTVTSQPWSEQIVALGSQGLWSTATRLWRLALPFSTGEYLPPPLLRRLAILRAWELFNANKYDLAIDAFIRLEISPVKVVSLYPEIIAGKLVKAEVEKEEVFGGRSAEQVRKAMSEEEKGDEAPATTTTVAKSAASSHQHHSLAARFREPTTTSAASRSSSVDSARLVTDSKKTFNRSVDELVRFLTDRRQQYNKALAALLPSARPSSSQARPSATPEELFDLPDEPLSTLKPDQLARVAQVVDTALFKSYLATKPVMVGPLCRIENWCEVEEVEELLLNAKKYRELLDLYNGKSMHDKAVKLLRRMSEDEDDDDEKVDPTVRYLQKLGAAHLATILTASEWVFSLSRSKGLEIFIADLEEVESLPRHATMEHLDKIGSDACIGYLEHLIHALGEQGAEFHEKLIELYLGRVGRPQGDEAYAKLLAFLESSTSYRADRMLGRLPTTSDPDDVSLALVRALLLGRLGRHEGALQIYVYQLSSPLQAEDYCRRVSTNVPDIFHVLLRIYLRPRADHPLLFRPALDVISKYAAWIDPIVVFDLLPPLVSVSDLQTFLEKTLRRTVEQKRDRVVLKGVAKSWVEQGERDVTRLQERRVKVSEGRVCPVCGKRLGNSVLSIHNPRGEVVHYQCREAFQDSRKDLL